MVFQMILTSSFQVMSRYIYFTSLLHICRALTQKNPLGFQQNQKTSVDQKLTPQKSHEKCNFQKQVWSYFIRRSTRPGYAGT